MSQHLTRAVLLTVTGSFVGGMVRTFELRTVTQPASKVHKMASTPKTTPTSQRKRIGALVFRLKARVKLSSVSTLRLLALVGSRRRRNIS